MEAAGTPISHERALELERLLLRQEMQEEITSWAKKRFAMLGIVAAILGFFGVSTVLHQSLQILLARPVEQELEKFEDVKERLDEARDQARDKIIELSLLSANVEEQGRKAQAAAEAATQKIVELETSIATAAEKARDIAAKYEGISGGLSRVSGDLHSLATNIREEEKRLRVEVEKATAALGVVEEFNAAIAKASETPQLNTAFGAFQAKMDAIETNYRRSLERLARIKDFNIVFYISRREDDDVAQAIVRHLKGEGYRATVWYTVNGERQGAIEEISGEFGEITDILQAHPSGIVMDPQHEDVATEIEQLLSADSKVVGFQGDVFMHPLQPIKQHLSEGQKTFDADKVILIYLLGRDAG